MTAILDPGPQLQCLTWRKDEDLIVEQWNRTRGTDIVKDQLPGEGPYSELKV